VIDSVTWLGRLYETLFLQKLKYFEIREVTLLSSSNSLFSSKYLNERGAAAASITGSSSIKSEARESEKARKPFYL
jgi:hypothetical protein